MGKCWVGVGWAPLVDGLELNGCWVGIPGRWVSVGYVFSMDGWMF